MNREPEPVKCVVCGKEGVLDHIQHPVSGAAVCMTCAANMGQISNDHRKQRQEIARRETEWVVSLRLALISAYVTSELMRSGPATLPSTALRQAEEFANTALQIPVEGKVH